MSWLSRLLNPGAPTPVPTAYVPPKYLTAFTVQMERPAFCNLLTGFFNRDGPTYRHYENESGRDLQAVIPPLHRSELNEARLVECYFYSVTFARLKRGLEITDRAGNLLPPIVHGDHFVVESMKNADDMISHVIAIGFQGSLSKEDYRLASANSLSSNVGAWGAEPIALTEAHRHTRGSPVSYNGPRNGIMPLYYLRLEVVVVPGDPGGDVANSAIRPDTPDAWQ